MKRFITFAILVSAVVGHATAQRLLGNFDGNINVDRYYDGIEKMIEANSCSGEAKANLLEDAIRYLAPLKDRNTKQYVSWFAPLELKAVDVAGELPSEGYYTYKNVCKIYMQHKDIKEEAALRGESDELDESELKSALKSRCRVKHVAIKAGMSVCYEDDVEGVVMVIVAAMPMSKIDLTVTSGDESYDVGAYEGGTVRYCRWTAEKRSKVRYRIENPGDSDVSIIIIAN